MSPVKPSNLEDDFFAKRDAEAREKHRERLNECRRNIEAEQLKEAHWMRCPKCGRELEEVNYRHVKIDKCTGCEGVWLDTGELEMLAGEDKNFFNNFVGLFKSGEREKGK